ncbi:MAG TPA: hypothetical protein VGU20_21710 [Stellaceae bacterium]|nr:hypothetical protein [Stellaceae bacterium]
MDERRKAAPAARATSLHVTITEAVGWMWLHFEAATEQPPKWRCISPIDNEGSGLPSMRTGR